MAASMESARKELAGEYERVQKKAFTNWINSHLIKGGQKVTELYEDLKDGSRLMMLIELLTGEKLPREKGKMRVHKLQNVQNALDYLTKKRKIKLVSIHSDGIVDGKPTPTLGLIWMLILHFQISGLQSGDDGRPMSPVEVSAAELKKKLLLWAQSATEGYEEVNVKNFTTSWKDGMAFCAIIDRHHPDLLNYDDCDPDTPLVNLEAAMSVAEKELGIVRLIDPEDIFVEKPDDKAIITYVSFLHNAFPDMPPSHRTKAPQVSLDDYSELFAVTRKWVQEKTGEVMSRDFPNTLPEMKAKMDEFHAYVTKQLPVKKRDVSSLRDLSSQLREQAAKKKKVPAIPEEMTFELLEVEWARLERENKECEVAMERELERLKKLEDVASEVLSSSVSLSSSLDQLEAEVQQYENSCTSLSGREGEEAAKTIREKLQSLQRLMKVKSGVQQLRGGNYHDVETVSNSVEAVESRVALLLSRLEGASSVATEAQEVVKVEDRIQELEVWLVSCGKFAANQNILGQIEEHKAFEREQLAVAKERVTRVTGSPPPPGLEGKVNQMNSRWQQIVYQTEERIAGLEPLEAIAREFDSLKNPLEDWLLQQTEAFDSLPPVEIAVEELHKEQESLSGLKKDISSRREAVEQLEEMANTFEMETEPVQSLADRYARRVKTQGIVPKTNADPDSREHSVEAEASFILQADALQSQWASLQTRVDARSQLVDNLLDRLSQFNGQYDSLRKFVDEGNRLLGDEKPVGEDAARLQEQMDMCQDFRSQIASKQPAVDALLALGRDIVAEPQTSTANVSLETRLTSFIEDWSNLQLAWQNWYNELHARKEQSLKLSEQVGDFGEEVKGLQGSLEGMFPATVEMDNLLEDMEALQDKFTVEVYQPYELLAATSESLKSSTAMLTDQSAAREVFEKFDSVAANVTSAQQELSGMVVKVKEWWAGSEDERKWLEGAESTLADLRPLAGSVAIVKTQKEENEALCRDVSEHTENMEAILASMAELASHDTILQPSLITEHHDNLKARWEGLSEDVEKRRDLSTSGHTHLTSYADQSVSFAQWLSAAEEKQAALAAIPGNRDQLVTSCEECSAFLEEVQSKSCDLEAVETTGTQFLGSAKPYQARVLEFRASVSQDEASKTPQYFVDPEAEVAMTVAPEFEGTEYENGITTVKGYSSLLRKRYDGLLVTAVQQKQRLEEARRRRAEFDGCLETVLPRLQELEERSAAVVGSGEKVSDRLETLRVIEVEAVAMETQLQALNSACDLLGELCESESSGQSEASRERDSVEARHRALMEAVGRMKDSLNAELSDAQAFQDVFSDFVVWLRETERKIQRDDPLRLEVKELRGGLSYLQGISADITEHEAAYEKVCSECRDLIGRGVGDPEELQRNLESLQQRWNAVLIVNDDIEAIETTIPKLESFYSSYGSISTEVVAVGDRLRELNTSTTSSGGISECRAALKGLHKEVEQQRSKFESILHSCDLYDTPFDQTQFEGDVTSLKEQLAGCDKVEAEKQASLTVLEKKIHPMEDLFSDFQAWLSASEVSLSSLSPPAPGAEERSDQLDNARAVVTDVQAHEETLEQLESAVNDVITLVDDSDQSELGSRLQSVSLRYHCHSFSCQCYPVERWLDDRSLQLCSMAPCGVMVTQLQNQVQEVQEFNQKVTQYRPQLDHLDIVSTKCIVPPPTPGGPKATKPLPTEPESASKVNDRQQEIWQRYNSLGVVATERSKLLGRFLPSVQQYESSRGAWGRNLEGWEERVSNFPPLATRPALLEDQIRDIKDLLQSISDHEPDYHSLKRDTHTLCQGPQDEQELIARNSSLRDSSSQFVAEQLADTAKQYAPVAEQQSTSTGQPSSAAAVSRPGQAELEQTLSEYDRRLEELKSKLRGSLSEREQQLESAKECEGLLEGVMSWLDVCEADLDGLRVRDPSSAVIEEQQQNCQGLIEDMEAKAADKSKLQSLVQSLTSDLPPESEEKAMLLAQMEELNSKWDKMEGELTGCQERLGTARSHAVAYEEAVHRLLPWVPDMLSHLQGLGACPTEPEAVEQRKNKIEALKTEYNSLAPVCATCLDHAHSLSAVCEEGEPRARLDGTAESLQTDWESLGKLFGDVLAKLTEALVQTQEFKSIAGGLEQWMSGMGETLNQQDLIAARVNLVEGQIEGFKPILSDISAYGETVEKVRAMGDSLKGESDAEEQEKIERRLGGLVAQFAGLELAAQERMKGLEDALEKATAYENRCDEFDQWLAGAEARLKSREPLSIASQPLRRQEQEMKEFLQEVASYKPALETVNQSEVSLFATDLSSIGLHEAAVIKQAALYRRSSTPRSLAVASPSPIPALGNDSSVDPGELSVGKGTLPGWLERPGASEAVIVGADIRSRYGALKAEVEGKTDQASQQLQSVLGYEADYDGLSQWLDGQKAAVASFSPPAITVEEIQTQITEVEDLQRGFTNKQEALESIDSRGTSLVDSCEDQLSRESGRMKLSDLNEAWGSCLGDLSDREEQLKGALERAEKYQGLYGDFDTWLSGCVEKAAEALRVDGDPSEISKQLEEQKALLVEVKAHKPALEDVVSSGRELEAYVQERGATGLADIGYSRTEDRYNTLEASLKGRISKLQQTLDRVGDTTDRLRQLLAQLEGWRDGFEKHKPPRVSPGDVEKQIAKLASVEQQYSDMQPVVSEAMRQASAFASLTQPSNTEGAELSHLHSSVEKSNEEVGRQVAYWSDLLKASLDNANKFYQDYNGLLSWVRAKDDELLHAEAVSGIPSRVEQQIADTEALQEEVSARRAVLTALSSLSQSMSENASPEDSLALSDRTAQVQSAFEALERNAAARKRVLTDGLEQAKRFAGSWEVAMEAVVLKSEELQMMSAVGADIDIVKTQLEEHKEFNQSVTELKPQISAVQAEGKQLKESCSTQDGPAITQQIEQLSTAWSKLYSDALSRKHQLEDALLQLGQFHDALAQLLSWIADCTGKLSEAPPPGVKSEAVETQLNELISLDSAIASHEPTVLSLNEAAQKLVASSTAENTAEIEQDITDLNERWDNLKSLAAKRKSSLEEALERAGRFHGSWKREADWLTDAERRAYTDWKPCGLPETCEAELTEHVAFAAEVQSHQEPIEALRDEGEALRAQGTPDDGKKVDHWVEDLGQRWEELSGAAEEREVELQQAKDKALEFDGIYQSLQTQLQQKDQALKDQELIHSEVEVVKQQLEEYKEYQKGLSELEGRLDELEGLGLLLASDCVSEDRDVILQRTNDLRSLWDAINSAAMERQSALEESLLSLGEFEEAYSELWAWLTDALRQLGEAEPITGDPDMVAAQLAKHKVLQKQLGARMSSRNAVTKAAKILMKQKTGEDRAVLKKKLQDLEREWEKVCQMSVDRQSRLEEAYRGIGQFRSHLGPLRSWMAKVLPVLDDSEPVHGDLDTVNLLTDAHASFQKELGAHQNSVDFANECGHQLVSEVLDDPVVTQHDLQEMNEMWDSVCQKSVQKQERLDEAFEAAHAFEEGFSDLMEWVDVQRDNLEAMPPPDEDASVLQDQIEENKAFNQEVTAKQPECDHVLAEGQNLLQLAHPRAVPLLQSKLQQLERAWVDLRGKIGSRSEALASLLLELYGLQDMLDRLKEWVVGAETTMSSTEAIPVGNDMETVDRQLSEHEAFQEEMATHQPNMDALNKIAKKRKATTPTINPEMTKKISSLYKRWQKLWLRSSERHRQLLEARTRLKDIALARSFNFDAWRKRFNGWVDQQKLRVNDLFRRFDSNHDGMLTREEFMKGLKASGLAMNQIELEKIADYFDRDHDGFIDLSEINSILRGIRRARSLAKRRPVTDSEKIDRAIELQVSRCCCSKKFRVIRVAEGQYRFGDSQKLRLVRILRSTVMVRVGGGWEPLEEFLRKYDPCRASGRTNMALRGIGPGLATASFTTETQSAIASKNAALRKDAGGDKMTVTDPSGRKHTVVTKRMTTSVTRQVPSKSSRESSRETTPTRTMGTAVRSEPIKHMLVRQGSPKTKMSGLPPRSKTPSRALSPTGDVVKNGRKSPKSTSTPTTPSHIPKPASALTPTGHAAVGTGPKTSRIPTPSKSKIPTKH